ncbi:MAG: recombinase family protein [Halopseudomonas sp.]
MSHHTISSPTAYSYVRFSRPEQMKGDSLRRQKELSEAYVREHNLVLDTTLHLNDLGVSAFSGANVDQGALGGFLVAIEQGAVKEGSYLLIESLDRISRQKVASALELFLGILRKGIIIVTLSDGMKYDYEDINTNELIISITIMSRAHEESLTKSKRLVAAWKKKRQLIGQQKMTRWAPAWLDLNDDRTEFNLIPERVSVIRDIFNWAASGLGTSLIIRRLEEARIKPWGIGRNRLPTKWHASYIQKIVTNRAVLGEFQSTSSQSSDSNEIVKGYYPAIIAEDLFYRVQEARSSRRVTGGGRKGKTLSNLFSKLAYCGYSLENDMGGHKCSGNDELMAYVNKGARFPIKYLQCSRLKNGNTGCERCKKMWRYDYFETAFLTHVKDINIDELLGTPTEHKRTITELGNQLSVKRGHLEHTKSQIEKITVASLQHDGAIPGFLIEKGIKLETEQQELEGLIRDTESTLNGLAAKNSVLQQNYNMMHDLIAYMDSADDSELLDVRIRLSELLKQFIDRIEVYSKGRITQEDVWDKVKEFYPDNEVSEYQKLRLENKNVTPFFLVHFKSGEKRLVCPDPKEPKKLITNLKWSDSEIIELEASWKP